MSLLGSSDEGAGDAELPLHAPGQVPAPLVALVRDPEVGDHPAALLLQLPRAPPVAALQLGVEPEVLGHRQPAHTGDLWQGKYEATWMQNQTGTCQCSELDKFPHS